jgi:hypothetical protein
MRSVIGMPIVKNFCIAGESKHYGRSYAHCSITQREVYNSEHNSGYSESGGSIGFGNDADQQRHL